MNRLSLQTNTMKCITVIKVSALAVVLSLTIVGCRKGLEKTTPLPGRGIASVPGPEPMGPINPGPGTATTTASDNNTTAIKPPDEGTRTVPIPTTPATDLSKPVPLSGSHEGWVADSDENQIFKSKTVYFDFDQATVKPSEVSKVQEVASGMKSLAGKALRIEGHCDERGTEEYNRSLGERRALAVRENLIRAGVDPNLIDTISFGEDRPSDPGHSESAWKKNRRGEFIIIVPAAPATSK